MTEKEMFELTNPQKSIWMMEQFYRGTNINNICATLTINTDVDMKKLNKAINIFVQNNKSFGLNFYVLDGRLRQYFRKLEDIEFEVINLKDEKEVKNLAIETAEEIFDIEGERLFKFKLYKLENGHGGYVVMTHHLISDAATMSIVAKETTEIYNKLVSGEDIEEKEYSYKQYILDEKDYLNSPKFEKDKNYWLENFADVPEVATIPVTLESSHTDLTGKAVREEFELNVDLLNKISQFCSLNKISNFNFFMAVYAIYLSRVNNLRDFVIGTPILNRTNFKEKHTTGMFINTAPLRIKIENNIDFISFVKSIAQSSMSMLRYQKYSYQMLLEELRKNHGNIPTLYDVMLSYQVTKANDREAKVPYEVEWLPTTTISNGVYVHLHDNDDDGSLNVAYDYQIEKYTKQDMINIHNRILHIIDQVLSNENCLEKDIEIVTPEEKHQILNVFNNTASNYPRDKTIIDLFEEQVEKTPDNVAVVCKDKEITYKELNEKINILANYLIGQGVKSNTVVGILMNRSIEMIIAILATVKSGGTYIPIDISYPEKRVKYILENSHAQVLLTNNSSDNLELNEYKKINVDFEDEKLKNGNIKNSKKNISKKDNLYIIYTSGSTGNPKGVVITHQNMQNFIFAMEEKIDFNHKKTMLSVTTISFDIFGLELYCSLLNGMKLVVADEEEQMNPRFLKEVCLKNEVSMIQTTPSRITAMLEEKDSAEYFKNFTEVLVGGEGFPKALLEKLKEVTNAKIYNMYGPTETTVWSTCKEIKDKITIGKPVTNTTCYILDDNMNLLPVNTPGCLYIGGEGVAKGYFENEKLTAEKFVEFKHNQERIYNTNDLAYWNENGELVHLGRLDFQIKLNGYRIDLSEIEEVILNYSGVSNCVVAQVNTQSNKKYLCAYVVANTKIDEEKIRTNLFEALPTYMIPSKIMQIEKMPYTPNGKIDRKSLPIPKFIENLRGPEDETEKEILEIVKETLKTEDIGVEDYLFDNGGDSLTAMALAVKLSEKFNINITIKDIYQHFTVEKISKYIKKTPKNQTQNKIPTIKNKELYNTSFAQQRMYYASQVAGNNSILYNISGGVILDDIPNLEKLERAINKLIETHSILRARFELQDGKLMQKIIPQFEFELIVNEEETNNFEKIFENFVKPFELLDSQLFRFELAITKDKKAFLMLDMHHSISDGTSLNILLSDLCKIYNGEEIAQETIEYKDFAEWEYKKIQNNEFSKSEKFWMEQFENEIPALNLPITYKRNSEESYAGASEQEPIDVELTNKINEIANELNCTPYMICLAAYYILLYRYTEQKDIIVGTPISGRYLPEIENVVGMFVNTLALRNKLEIKNSFKQYIQKIKEMCLNAYGNQEYPLELINEKLNFQREDGKRRLFDTMFIFQNNAYPIFSLDGIKAKYYIPKLKVSKFDISLELMNNEQNALDLRVEYCTELFDKVYATNFLKHYIKILQQVCQNTEIKINEIDILTQEENEILKKFNNTEVQYSKDETVIKVFEKQAKINPKKTAIVFENKKITYKELNEKANVLAKQLLEKGVTSKNVIGILLSRSENIIISMLAVLKTGCAYMLIDPNLPNDRINYMLSDSNAVALVTEEAAKYVKFKNKVFIDNVDYNFKKNINLEDDIENPFSVIYTSGSTGTPKGIKTTNKSILNLVNSYKDIIKADKYKNYLSICSMSFDMFTVEIILPLLLGKTIILTNEEEHKSPMDINNLIGMYDVEIIFITPSKCNLLLMANNSQQLAKLKNIQLGGENFKESIYNEIKEISKEIEIYNEYGPSEITSCCSIKHITNLTDISIGKPINNTQMYILNESHNICPVNIPGEICIAGEGVSLGYINNSEMNKRSFIQNPFGQGKIYKSGDIGKLNGNGEIEYINRKDEQIKIRGLRVELSEIEKQLIEIPEVENAAVIYKKEKEYISAFISANIKMDIAEIRKILSEKLPLYMLPKYITQIENLPITRNGKIDRKALQRYKENIDNAIKYAEPVTEEQKLFCGIWEKLLNTKIGIETDVFESGADSLIAIKFKTELLAQNIRVSYADIFKYKTVKDFCNHSDIITEGNTTNYDYTKINDVLNKNDISNVGKIINSQNNNALLFGATGFVGAHIVNSFIENDEGNIYCVVRDKNKKKAKERFLETLHFYFESKLDDFIDKRIFVINGDIYKENFNLTNAQTKELIEKVNIVINSAAVVKHFGNEDEFKDVNINATNNMIKFCKENKKRMIHISTLSVSGNSILEGERSRTETQENINFTEKDLYCGQIIENSYTKSKFEAEKLILENIEDGLNAQILRLGNITSRYSDGKFQINTEQNAFANKIRSFISLKCLPEYLAESELEFTPVDICCDAIIKILQNNVGEYTVFHLYNNNHVTIRKVIEYLKNTKIKISILQENQFKKEIELKLKENDSNILSGIINDLDNDKKLMYDSNIRIMSEFTRAFLYKLGFEWPEINKQYIQKYIKYLTEVKFLKKE